MSIEKIRDTLLECYSKDLCYPKMQCSWNNDNKHFGMSLITALIVNDYFGGNICKIYVAGISHYYNLIDNEIIDLTSKQFNFNIDYKHPTQTEVEVLEEGNDYLIVQVHPTSQYRIVDEQLEWYGDGWSL